MLFPILAALVAITLFYGERSSVPQKFEQDLPQLLVPQSTGKERQIVSMTRDASMFTERSRRTAIMAVHSCNGSTSKPIRESNKTAGFTNGVVEAYMLSSICNIAPVEQPVVPPICITTIYDGGFPYDDFQDILDGDDPGIDDPIYDIYYDGGGPTSNFVTVFDGLDPLSDVMDILYSRLNNIPILDGGNPNTNLC
jgi:hypothetical protein